MSAAAVKDLDARAERHLVLLSGATKALAKIKNLDEAKSVKDMAEAAAVWAHKARLGHQAVGYAEEIAVRATAKAGEFIARMEKAAGPGRGKKGEKKNGESSHSFTDTKKAAVERAGFSQRDANDAEQLSRIPPADLERSIAEAKAKEERISAAKIVKDFKDRQRSPASRAAQAELQQLMGIAELLQGLAECKLTPAEFRDGAAAAGKTVHLAADVTAALPGAAKWIQELQRIWRIKE